MKKLLFTLLLLGTEFGLGATAPLTACDADPAFEGSIKFFYAADDVAFESPVISYYYNFGNALLRCYMTANPKDPNDLGGCHGSWEYSMEGRIEVKFVRDADGGVTAHTKGDYAGGPFHTTTACK
jgi:hypothetical protein